MPGGRPSTIRYGWSVSKLCSVTVVMATQALRVSVCQPCFLPISHWHAPSRSRAAAHWARVLQVIKVPVDAVDVLGRYHSPKFQAAGHAWYEPVPTSCLQMKSRSPAELLPAGSYEWT